MATPDTGKGIGDVISLLWFKKQYPKWATEFIETVIKTVADHGLAVSGVHNAKVTARVELMNFAAEHFPSTPLLEYARTVEALTTSKKENLILNVDGTIGIFMVDMWRALGYSLYDVQQAEEI